jgi:hypothetical protein
MRAPIMLPIVNEINRVLISNPVVHGRALIIKLLTLAGNWEIDRPNSNLNKFLIDTAYWTHKGSSKPKISLYSAIRAAGSSTRPPAASIREIIAAAGSPGAKRGTKKFRDAPTHTTKAKRHSRLTTYPTVNPIKPHLSLWIVLAH